jgi:hypothetical protein
MKSLNREDLIAFANAEIEDFHNARLATLEKIRLNKVLRNKNPYLFRAKNVQTAGELIKGILDAHLSSSEESMFGRDVLENVAVYVASQTVNGHKSAAEGIDLEFEEEGVHYLVSIKSGPNWGNSSQVKRLADNFQTALRVVRQGKRKHVQAVLGICYGKSRTSDRGDYIKMMGQRFWHFLSGDPDLYLDLIEPIGYRADEHNATFDAHRAALENRFVANFIRDFCHPDGAIDWSRLIAFNSGNLADEE